MKFNVYIVIIIICIYDINGSNETLLEFQMKQTRLIQHLLKDYKSDVAPLYSRARYSEYVNPISVDVGITYARLLSVDSLEQSITVITELIIKWPDFRLKWNPDDFDGIKEVVLPSYVLWAPDITPEQLISVNPISGNRVQAEMSMSVTVKYNGSVTFIGTLVQTVLCVLDIGNFPKDTQLCHIVLTSYTYISRELTLRPFVYKSVDLKQASSGEWAVVSISRGPNNTREGSDGLEYPTAQFFVSMKRNSQFYFVLIVIPSIILTSLAFIGMFFSRITKETLGEKINLGFSAILATIMIIQITTENQPKSSYVPILSIFVTVNLILELLSVTILSILGIFLINYDKSADKDGCLFSISAKRRINHFITRSLHVYLLLLSITLLVANLVFFLQRG